MKRINYLKYTFYINYVENNTMQIPGFYKDYEDFEREKRVFIIEYQAPLEESHHWLKLRTPIMKGLDH